MLQSDLLISADNQSPIGTDMLHQQQQIDLSNKSKEIKIPQKVD